MRLCIADPPYLGRADRWYGLGRGSGGGRHRADSHPDAARWDDPATHVQLMTDLARDFDGWAVAAAPDSLPVYLAAVPDVRVMVWHRRNAPPSGSRIRACWEPVLVHVPDSRRGRGWQAISDVLDEPGTRGGFAGAKPPRWTRWVLDALGYDPQEDELVDMFKGSGAVAGAAAGMLSLVPESGGSTP